MKKSLVLIGNGMAGMRAIEELLELENDQYDITVYGAEPYGNYNRILLSPVLAGEKTIDQIMLNDTQWYKDNNIELHAGKEVIDIDRRGKKVFAADGTTTKYDRLLIATGSTPIVIPVPGHQLPGVISFRDIKDVDNMIAASTEHKHAVVIGGGLLGLEAANGLLLQGMHVSVVHLEDTLMERQLDKDSGAMLRSSLEDKGLQFLMEANTESILGENHVTGVRFSSGLEIAADLVVMAVGIRPNIELAKKIGLYCEKGIVVNDTMQTYDPSIYAVGECVQHRGQAYGLVAPLFEQAKVCANHLANLGYSRYEGSLTSTKLKVTGIDLFSAGNFIGDESTEEIVMKDQSIGVYKKLVLRENKIIGAVMYGDTIDGAWYFQMLREGTDISDIRSQLMLGRSHIGDSGHSGMNAAESMTDDMEVCGCNGICKGTIVKAITTKGLFTVDDVRAHTKASNSCGSCTGLVEQLLASTLGGDYSAAPHLQPLCKCTEHSHDTIQETIKKQKLTSIRQIMDFMEWNTADGCAKCRPALNYYLIVFWPEDSHDDPQSRFINERAHANIQKDGTYSVIPRIWGGVTNPNELRAIADVVDKFEIPTIKFTGGQRLDLLGVKKQDLKPVWADLNKAGLVSGHAYGKALRTVKTCVGQEWCRFGTQNSMSMGVKLEKLTWGSWMPHKFKMAVSGCPRNCAEATIKDFGIVAVDSGWELHVGGNGGIKVRATDLLCKVTTEEEVYEYACAFVQLYREDAHYLERTAPWIERKGLSHVKEAMVDDEANRKALCERFLLSQKLVQQDPWADRATGGVESHEFAALAKIS
ncbi:MAG: nitrite reductase large subunit NirB [Thiohalomonadales bacterium]